MRNPQITNRFKQQTEAESFHEFRQVAQSNTTHSRLIYRRTAQEDPQDACRRALHAWKRLERETQKITLKFTLHVAFRSRELLQNHECERQLTFDGRALALIQLLLETACACLVHRFNWRGRLKKTIRPSMRRRMIHPIESVDKMLILQQNN